MFFGDYYIFMAFQLLGIYDDDPEIITLRQSDFGKHANLRKLKSNY